MVNPTYGPVDVHRVGVSVANVYYLLLYAWGYAKVAARREVPTDNSNTVLDLFADLIADGVERLLRRGVRHDYVEYSEMSSNPRGRILLRETISRPSPYRVALRSDHLSLDIVRNQILRGTLHLLGGSRNVEQQIAKRCRALSDAMSGVRLLPVSKGMFRRIQPGGGTRDYDLLLRAALFVVEALVPGEGHGRFDVDIRRDEIAMGAVFEEFLRAFLKREQSFFHVQRNGFRWNASASRPSDLRYLPSMQTDISLYSDDLAIVVDAKFYRRTFVSYREGHPKVWASHLFQLLAYLSNVEKRKGRRLLGVLLYPKTTPENVRIEVVVDGYPVWVYSVDLASNWRSIRAELHEIIERFEQQRSGASRDILPAGQ